MSGSWSRKRRSLTADDIQPDQDIDFGAEGIQITCGL